MSEFAVCELRAEHARRTIYRLLGGVRAPYSSRLSLPLPRGDARTRSTSSPPGSKPPSGNGLGIPHLIAGSALVRVLPDPPHLLGLALEQVQTASDCSDKNWSQSQRLRCWRPLFKGTVRPDRVVLPLPALDQHPCLLQRVEDLPVEQLVSKLAVEALAVPVFPRTPWLNEQRTDLESIEPLPYRPSTELRGAGQS